MQSPIPREKGHTPEFWLGLIRDVFGIIKPEDYIEFEKEVYIEHVKFIDAYIPSTGIVIEQKSPGKNLDDAFSQAKNYYDWLPLSQRGRYIITCDFDTIRVHDMEEPTQPPEIIPVSQANKDNLNFLLIPGETRTLEELISIKAGELVKTLRDYLMSQVDEIAKTEHYTKEQREKAVDDINVFCVRLVFLLYAEDAGVFTKHQFHDYLEARRTMARDALAKLFTALKTAPQDRDPFDTDPELAAFPQVNGGLFSDNVRFPYLNDEAVNTILVDMSEKFNWAGISPTIFGAVFESTLNDETRRNIGIHYTSIDNIHKVIDPLFLDDINDTLNAFLSQPPSHERTKRLLALQDKLASLKFLDPACGSGNFLTESFIHLRRLENRLLANIPPTEERKVKVSIKQFYGIEVHNFAVNIAKTALWISYLQMWAETYKIFQPDKPALPLDDYNNIDEADALRADIFRSWEVPHDDMLYIMGNPPFLGYTHKDSGQKEILKKMFPDNWKVDYAAGWFSIASEYISRDNKIKAAFVATNSICQGAQAAGVFKPLSQKWGMKIEFAYQSFVWKNELPDPTKMAHVHVVIICISNNPPEWRSLYTAEGKKLVKNINFYLEDGPDEDVAEETKTPISTDVPDMILGNLPRDDGRLIIELKDYADFIKREPKAKKYIKRYIGAEEFLNNKLRYCLWLVNATPQDIKNMPRVYERVKAVKVFREASTRKGTQKLANKSWLFAEIRQPAGRYIAIPQVSSESREYIPMDWLDDSVIPGNALHIIPDATLYHFGILTSRVHMAWMRRVCGRLEMRYRYSKNIVYNTFAWPDPSPEERAVIERTAQEILDARGNYPDSSLSALYDDTVMPLELREAHERNDRAVCRAYGWEADISEGEIVGRLFGLYHILSGK